MSNSSFISAIIFAAIILIVIVSINHEIFFKKSNKDKNHHS